MKPMFWVVGVLFVAVATSDMTPPIAGGEELAMRECADQRETICFEDASGASAYWLKNGSVFSAEIKARQQRYNVWYNQAYGWAPGSVIDRRVYSHDWSGLSADIPSHIDETGRLDIETVAIPYYQSVHRLLNEVAALNHDCNHNYTRRSVAYREFCNAVSKKFEATSSYSTSNQPPQRLPFDAAFLRRIEALENARDKARAYGRAMQDVFANPRFNAWRGDGFNPEQLPTAALESMEVAHAELGVALEMADWASAAYRGSKTARRGN